MSPVVATGEVTLTLVTFTLVYGMLGVVELFLLRKYVRAGPDASMTPFPKEPDDDGDDSTERDDGPPDDRDDAGADRDDVDDDEDADRLVFAY